MCQNRISNIIIVIMIMLIIIIIISGTAYIDKLCV